MNIGVDTGPDSTLGVLAANPLLVGALLALCLAIVGGALVRTMPRIGSLLRGLGSFGLAAVLVMTIIDIARLNPELAMPQLGIPEQVVEGSETRIPLSRDGHYWIEAQVNGQPQRFLIDTGASLTAIGTDTADRLGIEHSGLRGRIALQTANGTAPAHLSSIAELQAGNIVARDLDVVVAPSMNDINVLGMNFLSRLKSWQVEEGTLVLVPRGPDATVAAQ